MANLNRVAAVNAAIAAQGNKGYSVAPSATVSTGNSSQSTSGSSNTAGAVNAKGQIIDSSGKVLGMANPADRYSPNAVQAEPTDFEVAVKTKDKPTPLVGGQIQPQTATQPTGQELQTSPSPETSRQTALNHLQKLGYTNPDEGEIQGAMEDLNIGPKFKSAVQSLTQSGGQAPQTMGAALGPLNNALSTVGNNQTPPVYNATFESVPSFNNLMNQFTEFMLPETQKTSLVEEYKKIWKQEGIEDLNAEAINLKNVIEGTEDDIRDEITKANGFATDSQVLALTYARNKTLIKQFNRLSDTIQSKKDYINNLMNLEAQDREAADRAYDRKFRFGEFVMNYQMKMQDAARQTFNTLLEKAPSALYNGLLASPSEALKFQSLMGIDMNTLSGIANQYNEANTLALELKREQILTEKAKRANIYSQISERGTGDIKAQQKIQNSAKKADIILKNVNKALGQMTGTFGSLGRVGLLGSILSKIPETSAYNLNSTIETVRANIGFEELQRMRESSPTGGALGQVAIQELERLEAVLGNLRVGQSPDQLKDNLEAIKDHYTSWLNTVGYEVLQDGQIVKILN